VNALRKGSEVVTTRYGTIVIGSGFGGCMAAAPLVEAGDRVLMLERGGWVARDDANWGDDGAFVLTPFYTKESLYTLRTRFGWRPQGLCACVGGPSVFYGGASFRFRVADFEPPDELRGRSAAAWPIRYADLEEHYGTAERLLGVAGEAGIDPTEPPRSAPYSSPPAPLAETSARIGEAAAALGLHPFRIPAAIDGTRCVSCTTCDAFACAVSAKNDLATRMLPGLIDKGMELRAGMVAMRLLEEGGAVRAVEAFDTATGRRVVLQADRFVLAAGALATPHLILASRLEARSAGGGVRPLPDAALQRDDVRGLPGGRRIRGEHHKQIAIHDYYFGDAPRARAGKLGNIQQVMAPPVSLVRAMLPGFLRAPASAIVPRLTGLLVIAEDQPRSREPGRAGPGALGPLRASAPPDPAPLHPRDRAARRALLRRAREVLRRAGALFTVTWNVNTFSHAVGTVRMGNRSAHLRARRAMAASAASRTSGSPTAARFRRAPE
jgi:hypothetical protein